MYNKPAPNCWGLTGCVHRQPLQAVLQAGQSLRLIGAARPLPQSYTEQPCLDLLWQSNGRSEGGRSMSLMLTLYQTNKVLDGHLHVIGGGGPPT